MARSLENSPARRLISIRGTLSERLVGDGSNSRPSLAPGIFRNKENPGFSRGWTASAPLGGAAHRRNRDRPQNGRDFGGLARARPRARTRRRDAIPVEANRVPDDLFGLGPTPDPVDVHYLVLEHLVVEEEALDLPEAVGRQLGHVPVVGVLGIVHVDRDDLVVGALL